MDNTEQFNCISLCTGYAGIELGLRRCIHNLRTVVYVERESFAVANLVSKIEAGKLDAAPIWTDIKTFDGRPFRDRVHIITGGYPCQPFSVAGKRQGTEDPRHLWPYIERIIQAVRPVWCFFENVGGHLTIGFPEVYRSLRLMGYSVEAGLFTAAEVGAPHKRERLFILAHTEVNRPSIRRQPNGNQKRSIQNIEGQEQSVFRSETERGNISLPASELADTTNNGLPGQQSGSVQEGQFNPVQEQSERRGPGRSEGCRWPSRPGQPQYEWEEPRVVANAISKRSGGKGGDAEHEGRETSKAGGKGLSQDSGREDGIAEPNNQPTGGDGASEGQTKPRLGRKPDGSTIALDIARGIRGGYYTKPGGEIGHNLVLEAKMRVDRLRLLGNGVIPAQAELAFRTLIRKF